MTAKWPEPLDASRTQRAHGALGPVPDPYPALFVFHTDALRHLDYDQPSATILAQLCDVLMIVEASCAKRFAGSQAPINQCSLYLLELLMAIVDEGRRMQKNFLPTQN